jgi:predicted N-acetyltransferase YhbS
MSDDIHYARELDLDVDEFIAVLRNSTLGARRPIDDRDRVARMLVGSDLVLTARVHGELIGASRAITDFAYCCYLADLAVTDEWQRQGIGRELIRRTHAAAGPETMLILLAAPAAESYYPHIGLQPHHSCWTIPRER